MKMLLNDLLEHLNIELMKEFNLTKVRNWTDMLKHVLNKYLNTVHSSTYHTPKEGLKYNNTARVSSTFKMKKIIIRKYPVIEY